MECAGFENQNRFSLRHLAMEFGFRTPTPHGRQNIGFQQLATLSYSIQLDIHYETSNLRRKVGAPRMARKMLPPPGSHWKVRKREEPLILDSWLQTSGTVMILLLAEPTKRNTSVKLVRII